MFCPKCGTKNDEDAKYCKGCSQSLQKDIPNYKEKNENSGINKGVKTLIAICVVLIAVIGVTAGMLLQKSSGSPQQYQLSTPSNLTVQQNTTIKNNTQKKQSNNGKKLFNGKYYIIINKELEYVGESWPICPFCGSKDTVDVGTKTEGNYWYYFFHCNSCSKNFVSYAKNY